MTEKEYIEREALVEQLKKEECDCEWLWTILCVPAADVEPVRHGHWIETAHKGYKCSLCNCLSSLFDENLKSEYCPWCGAKMDGGVQNGRRGE